MTNNPLQKYMRSPKIYVKLPSKGVYYDESILKESNTNEIAILPMTANDELALTTPDALLNGDGIKEVVESCCPAVVDAEMLTSSDVDTIMLGIRFSSYGDKLPFQVKCPVCDHENEFRASIRGMLDRVKFLEPPYIVDLNQNLKVHVRPHTFAVTTKLALQSLETSRLLRSIQSQDQDKIDFEQLSQYNSSFKKIAAIDADVILDSIDKVVITEDGNTIEVVEEEHLMEWLRNISKKEVDAIKDKVREINNIGPDRSIEVTCEGTTKENDIEVACNHKWETLIEFNPAEFFE